MTFISKVAKILGFGPDRWDERLAEALTMISPDGNEFQAKWIDSKRTLEKKLGVFSYPKVAGNVVQDKDVNSGKHTIPFFFTGDNNDIDSNDFFRAASERGRWSITHPVHGFLELQLMSVTETDAPVDKGNVTAFETEWIEPIDEVTLLTGRQMAGTINASIDDLNVNAAQQFADNLKSASETLRANIEDAVNLLDDITEESLGPLFTTVDALNASFRAIQNGIQDTLLATVYKAESLAGQIQQLIQQSVLATTDTNSRADAYDQLKIGAAVSLSATSGDSTEFAVNNAAVQELGFASVIASFANIATTSTFASKAQAVAFSDDVISIVDEITNALDTAQSAFFANDVDAQYFSQTQSYSVIQQLIGQVTQYLLITAFDLRVEKRFILDRPRCPIDITIDEYGSLGDNDSNYDLFLSSNELKNNDIILLPAGREVVVYV